MKRIQLSAKQMENDNRARVECLAHAPSLDEELELELGPGNESSSMSSVPSSFDNPELELVVALISCKSW